MLLRWGDENPSLFPEPRSYAEYLFDPRWRRIIRERTQRMFGVCWVCGMNRGRAERLNGRLETAHIIYPAEPFTERISADELTASDVVLLCWRDHRDFDDVVDARTYASRDELHQWAVEYLRSMRRTVREEQGYHDAD
jgi:hypothetical protein